MFPKRCHVNFILSSLILNRIKIDDKQVFAPLGTHKLTIIEKSGKSQKYFFEKCWVQNGRGHIFSKNKYFFDLFSNIVISSKLRGVPFFYSFDTQSHAEHGLEQNIFSKKISKKGQFLP